MKRRTYILSLENLYNCLENKIYTALTTCFQYKMILRPGIAALYLQQMLLILLVMVSTSGFAISYNIILAGNIMRHDMLILWKLLVSFPVFFQNFALSKLLFDLYACTVVICIRIVPLPLNISFNLSTQ